MAVRYQISGAGAAEISVSVEAGVRTGALPPGFVLPPVRALAGELGVAPATVAAAYKSLRQRGLVETNGRNGTRVRARPPVASSRQRPVVPPGTVDLSSGEPDARLLPPLAPRLRRLAARGLDRVGYGQSGLWPAFVSLARSRLAADGVPVQAITVTNGTLDAVERLLGAHLRPGDRVGIEDPGWANLIDLVASLGLETHPIPVDAEGPTVDGVAAAVRAGVAAMVVTSRAQNPTGAAISATRAVALRKVLARAPGVLVIEDDHAAELADVPLATLAGATANWAFLRSLSKPYGPDLRVCVMAGDEAGVARVEGRMRLGAGWVSTVLQRLVLELWQDPGVHTLIERARTEYRRRREGLVDALADRGVDAHGRTGINVWVPVADELTAVAALRERGWAVAPGALYRLASPPGLRITVSPLAVSDVEALADAILAGTANRPAPLSR